MILPAHQLNNSQILSVKISLSHLRNIREIYSNKTNTFFYQEFKIGELMQHLVKHRDIQTSQYFSL